MSWLFLESGARPAFLGNLSGIGEALAIGVLAFIHFGPLLAVMVTLAISFHEAFFDGRRSRSLARVTGELEASLLGAAMPQPAPVDDECLSVLEILSPAGMLPRFEIRRRAGRELSEGIRRALQAGLVEQIAPEPQEVLQLTPAGREALRRSRERPER